MQDTYNSKEGKERASEKRKHAPEGGRKPFPSEVGEIRVKALPQRTKKA